MSKSKVKKILKTALITLALVLLPAIAASAETYSGNCGEYGDDVRWTFDTETGVLNITGTGGMDFFSYTSWSDYCSSIKTVIIGNGVTSISYSAFDDCSALTSVDIGSGVTDIGTSAFNGCEKLTEVRMTNSVKEVEEYAFYDCTELKTVYFSGSRNDWKNIEVDDFNSELLNANIIYTLEEPGTVTAVNKLDTAYSFSIHSARGLDLRELVCVAVFDKNDVLTTINSARGIDENGDVTISVPIIPNAAYAKVFVWNKDFYLHGDIETVPIDV